MGYAFFEQGLLFSKFWRFLTLQWIFKILIGKDFLVDILWVGTCWIRAGKLLLLLGFHEFFRSL